MMLKDFPIELKYAMAAQVIDLYEAAKKDLIWVFQEESIYPIYSFDELEIIKVLANKKDLKIIKIFESMLRFGGITDNLRTAIYYAAKNGNKPLTHWLYTNINKKCYCTCNCGCDRMCHNKQTALVGAMIHGDAEWARWIFDNYTEGCRPSVDVDFVNYWVPLGLPSEWIIEKIDHKILVDCGLVNKVIRFGNFPLLQHLYANFPSYFGSIIHFNSMISYRKIEMIKWYYTIDNGIVINKNHLIQMIEDPIFVDLIEWLYEQRAITELTTWLFNEACNHKNSKLVNLLLKNNTDGKLLAIWMKKLALESSVVADPENKV